MATLLLVALIGAHGTAGLTLPGPSISPTTAMLWEMVLTVGLVSVILGSASGSQNVGPMNAMAVAGYIALAGLWAAPISGASMNTARSLGPALVLGESRAWWAYLVGPMSGSIIAVGIAYLLRGRGGGYYGKSAAQGGLGSLWFPGPIEQRTTASSQCPAERVQMPISAVAQVTNPRLAETAKALIAGDKGLLAMDESNPTCNERFAALGIPQREETRRAYRELLVTTPRLSECISGAILCDETIRQQKRDGTPFVNVLTSAGIIPGIKVDTGSGAMAGHPGEHITEGLDGLRARLAEYSRMGARFAKWRAVIALGDGLPSRGCVEASAHTLARYAALCQEAGLVPIVEPEVLMEGDHGLERCYEVTEQVLRTVFLQLYRQRVKLEGLLLKPNMVLPGLTCPAQASVDEVADATVSCLLRAVPAAVPGITFLSGGQSPELASARLNAMNVRFKTRLPWPLAFSFARAIQQPALEMWRGEEARVPAAQRALFHRAKCNQAARRGDYTAELETN